MPSKGFADGGFASAGTNPFVQALQQAQMQAQTQQMGQQQPQGQAPAQPNLMQQGQYQQMLNNLQQTQLTDDQRANILNTMLQSRGMPQTGGGLASLTSGMPNMFRSQG